ncbi:MAG: 3'-5' exonuclease [Nitrospirae bacterium]|nr:3'-5' exonuclease [Nitrospirota bacterium]
MLSSLIFNKKSRATGIDGSMPAKDARYVVIDTELTGLNEKKDSIVSIGAVRMAGGKIDLGDVFYRLINPYTEFRAESVVIHGITPSDVGEKPDIATILSEFLEFCGPDILIGHCISIDLCFINKEMKKIPGSSLKNAVLDTYSLYEWLRKRMTFHKAFSAPLKDCSLYGIAKGFGIPANGAHNAVVDAFITAQVFQRFIPILLEAGVRSIGELLRVGNPSRGGDRLRSAGESISL